MPATADAVRSLFVPVTGGTLLLPGTVVAEIVPYAEPGPVSAGADPWLVGLFDWRDYRIPLVAYEAAFGQPVPTSGSATRIAVLKALSNLDGLPYFGIIAQQIPRLVTVQEDSIERLDAEGESAAFAGQAVLANGEPAVIPDLDWLETQLHRQLNKE